jgi:hypothetical protein
VYKKLQPIPQQWAELVAHHLLELTPFLPVVGVVEQSNSNTMQPTSMTDPVSLVVLAAVLVVMVAQVAQNLVAQASLV